MITSSETEELLALRAEVARLNEELAETVEQVRKFIGESIEIQTLNDENAALKADAERYRKLKAHMTFTDIASYSTHTVNVVTYGPSTRRWYHDSSDLFATTLDAAIDAMKDGK
jgi:hypothetical protein